MSAEVPKGLGPSSAYRTTFSSMLRKFAATSRLITLLQQIVPQELLEEVAEAAEGAQAAAEQGRHEQHRQRTASHRRERQHCQCQGRAMPDARCRMPVSIAPITLQ